ncbi:MAG TPA: hypothetical protein VEK06_04750, partial [Myxococcota bacterium]|nr:hypothetical protein [Myxococcota bacterium]
MMNYLSRMVYIFLIAWGLFMSTAKADVHTQSNFEDVAVLHMDMNLDLKLDEQFFEGYVDLTLKHLKPSKEVILDTNGLKITDVYIADKDLILRTTNWNLGAPQPVNGQALHIDINEATHKVRVH